MKNYNATIYWNTNNGVGMPHTIDGRFYPLMIRCNDTTHTPWSIEVFNISTNNAEKFMVSFRLLVENKYTLMEESFLAPGTEFILVYGPYTLASGIITE